MSCYVFIVIHHINMTANIISESCLCVTCPCTLWQKAKIMTNVRMDQCVISFRLLLIWLMLMFVLKI